MAEGKHPFPSRTRQLSPPAPMVLAGQLVGRVGRRLVMIRALPAERGEGFSFAVQHAREPLPAVLDHKRMDRHTSTLS